MARPIWKGNISFGLVSIPVNLFPVEQNNELHFHLLDSRDHSRIRYERINEETGQEVPWEEVVKAYEFDKDKYIVVDEEEFEKASPETFKSIDIEEFVDFADIDVVYFDRPYFLVPDSQNEKAYVLLREALKETKKVGVARVIIRTKQYLSLIIPHQHALILMLVHYSEDLRQDDEFSFPAKSLKSYKIDDRELKMAIALIDEMSTDWQPEKYHDQYRETLIKWIENKANQQGKPAKTPKRIETKQDDIVDFIGLLKNSMKKSSHKRVTGKH